MRRRLLYGKEESECTCDSVGSCFDVIMYEELDPGSHVSANTQGPIPEYIIPYTGDSVDVGEVIICGGTKCNCLDFDVVEGTVGSDLISCYRDDRLITIAADPNPYTTDLYNEYYIEFRNKSTSATCDDDPFVQWVGVTLQANPGGGENPCVVTIRYEFSTSGVHTIANDVSAFSGMSIDGGAIETPTTTHYFDATYYDIEFYFDNEYRFINDGAFSGVTGITKVDLCSSVGAVEIGQYAFAGCDNLRSVEDGVMHLVSGSTGAFAGCSSLSAVTSTIDNNLPNGTFTGCRSLKGRINLTNVEVVGDYAFFDCDIEYLHCDSRLTRIGDWAIASSRFNKLCVQNTSTPLPTISSTSIRSDVDFDICIPEGSMSIYESNPNWNYYSNHLNDSYYCCY